MAGRKPKPTQLKVITGNPGKRALNKSEPKPKGNLAAAPDHFGDEQKAVWDYAIEHAPAGLLKQMDLSVLEVWVNAVVAYRDAVNKVAVTGQVIKSPSGYPVVNPYLSNMNKQAQIMLKAAAEMGFTPSSRSRIVLSDELEQNDPWAKFASKG